MKTLLFTIVLLMGLALLTTSRMSQALDRQALDIGILGSATAKRQADNDLQDALFDYFRQATLPRTRSQPLAPPEEKKPKKRSDLPAKENLPGYRPPRLDFSISPPNAKLDMHTILEEEEEVQQVFKEVFERLVDLLYAGHPLFSSYPRLGKELANALIEGYRSAGHLELSLPEDLGKIPLKDPKLQSLWYAMLRGAQSLFTSSPLEYPSILDYVFVYKGSSTKLSFNQNSISILYAQEPLLIALFNSSSTALSVMQARAQFAQEAQEELSVLEARVQQKEQIDEEERLTQQSLEKRFEETLEAVIMKEEPHFAQDYLDVLDYSLAAHAAFLTGKGGDRRSGIVSVQTITAPPLIQTP